MTPVRMIVTTMRLGWLRGVSAMALVAFGCFFDPIDLSQFPCPCTAGYECEPTTNRCLPLEGDGVVLVNNLRADWTTPNWIHWEWEPEAPDDLQLARYELIVAESVDDLLDRAGTARVFDPDTNPELGRYTLPRAGDQEIVDGTFSSGHEEDTVYFARLSAIDTGGRIRWSNVAQARTGLAPVSARVIIDEEEPQGIQMPPEPCYRWETGQGAWSGSSYYLREQVCTPQNDQHCEPNDPEELACFVNLVTYDMELPLGTFSRGDFGQAYMEFAMVVEDSTTSFWSQVGVQFTTSEGQRLIPTFDEVTFSSTSDYVIYQLRLDRMNITDPLTGELRLLTYEDIEDGAIDGYRVGVYISNGALLRLDSVAIRW